MATAVSSAVLKIFQRACTSILATLIEGFGDLLIAHHSLLIGERTAEQIKINIGAAMKDLDNPPDDIPVNGRYLR